MEEESCHIPMPLLGSSFAVGSCRKCAEGFLNEGDRDIALGEYYYFTGRAEMAARTVEPYLDSKEMAHALSAALICTFANLSRGHIHLAQFAMNEVSKDLPVLCREDAPTQSRAMAAMVSTAASVLLHLPIPETLPLESYIRYLPTGQQLWAWYLLAHKAYLGENYERSLAIVDMALSMYIEVYPIAAIYNHLIAVMDLMSLKRTEEAKEHFRIAWELAKPDDLIEPFAEHHGLLQGMVEIFFKKSEPEEYRRITEITYTFSSGWRKMHSLETSKNVADNLTTTEFTIAMLYSRGWTKKEVAFHLEISVSAVKKHVEIIYEKLGITDKKQLKDYMLQ
ncbi:MAG: LuxR C-terminal-related transcriptional regulator [Lachnospiraceae bacterium]|nr:LuxR C-terminal-related transcriptional regulator [Lachnospiraceae bacterium]